MKLSNQKVINKKLIIGMFLLAWLVMSFSLVSAYTRSIPQGTVPGVYTSGYGGNLIYDESICRESGEDFIMQLAPFGCQPQVVRSDLLEDQDSSVFCKIVATKINPLVEVEAISRISFLEQQRPEIVKHLGYHPAQAALGVPGQLTSPVLNEMGYLQIVLGKTTESDLQNCEEDKTFGGEVCWVEGNLTAEIQYDLKNAWGVGNANYYLPQISDKEFNENYKQYGFWKGRGYLKAESIDSEGATISVYSGVSTPSSSGPGQVDYVRQKIGTVTLEKGEKTQSKIYLPGIGFCMAGLDLQLNDVKAPDTRAKLKINSEVVEVVEGEKFLDGRCYIPKGSMDKQGVTESVLVRCSRTDNGNEVLSFSIEPSINISINGEMKKISVGDYLFEYTDDQDIKGGVYVGFIGTKNNLRTKENLYVRFVFIPGKIAPAGLTEDEIEEMAVFDSYFIPNDLGIQFIEDLEILAKFSIGKTIQFSKRILKGWRPDAIEYSVQEKDVFEKKIKIIDFSDPVDIEIPLDTELRNYYENAIKEYDLIINSYSDVEGAKGEKLGEQAFYNKIELLMSLDQKRAAFNLCEDFKARYPETSQNLDVCDNKVKFASPTRATEDIVINNEVKRISFEGIYEPTFLEYGARVMVRNLTGHQQPYNLHKDQIIYLDNDQTEYMQLVELEDDRASVKIITKPREGIREALESKIKHLTLNTPQNFGTDYMFSLEKINLERVAFVSLIPEKDFEKSQTSFNFKIGIEKRSIELSPEKIEKKIENSEKRISGFEKIHDTLDSTVQTWNSVCLASELFFTAKNFVENAQGKGIARQLVMRASNGWVEVCTKEVGAGGHGGSQEKCLLDKADYIDADVNKLTEILNLQNTDLEEFQQACRQKDKESKLSLEQVVDTNCLMTKLSTQVVGESGELSKFKNAKGNVLKNPNNKDESVNLDELGGYLEFKEDVSKYTTAELRDADLYLRISNDGSISADNSVLQNMAEEKLYSTFTGIEAKEKESNLIYSVASKAQQVAKDAHVTYISTKETETYEYGGAKIKKSQIKSDILPHEEGEDKIYNFEIVINNGKEYFVFLTEYENNEFYISEDEVYEYNGIVEQQYSLGIKTDLSKMPELSSAKFLKSDPSRYTNKFTETPKVRYYEIEPYKGDPAIVPFDLQNGWYVAMKPGLSVLGASAFEDSGRVKSFYLCNAGTNGIIEYFSSIGDDDCQGINTGIAQTYGQFSGLGKDATIKLVSDAIRATNDAQIAYKSGVKLATILGESVEVGEPALGMPDVQCQDFMSPKDCNILFNICDPVVCPSSRCNFGGIYPVQDVVQSGIFGSIALCLPNAKEGIVVPVCLSGVNAGLEGWLHVEKAYQECLQHKLDTGETIGICDEIYSVYGCDFLWRQAAPIAKATIPNILSALSKQNTRGGAEYLFIKDAFEKSNSLAKQFTQHYKDNSANSFSFDSVEETGGSAVCKAYMSLSYPSGGKLLNALTEPDSPAQFHGRFDEITMTTVTNPPVSHYKVFYYIYSGSDNPSYFKVYLRSTDGGSFYQDTSLMRFVDGGYIPKGEYKTETLDFTAPSGYKELCISVNGQEECGFKEASTSFAVDYMRDLYLASEADNMDVSSERECMSGNPNVFSFANPNIQSGAEEFIDPAIYNRGITRICATSNPGIGTDISAGIEDSRWIEVGYCDDPKMKCWLDQQSVDNVIDSPDLAKYLKDGNISTLGESALEDVQGNYYNMLIAEGNYLTKEQYDDELGKIDKEKDNLKKVDLIDSLIDRLFYNYQKAYFHFLRGNAYKALTLYRYDKVNSKATLEFISPVFEFQDGTSKNNVYYQYLGSEKWKTSVNERDWIIAPELPYTWIDNGEKRGMPKDKKDRELIQSLSGKTYVGGLKLLVDRTIADKEGGLRNPDLVTKDVKMDHEGLFEDEREATKLKIPDQFAGSVDEELLIYFKFEDDKWKWASNLDKEAWTFAPSIKPLNSPIQELTGSDKEIVENLEGKDRYNGAAIIFGDEKGNIVSFLGRDVEVAKEEIIGENGIHKIARHYVEQEYDHSRIDEQGEQAKDYVCASFVTKILIESGISELEPGSGQCDYIPYLVSSFEDRKDFIEVNKDSLEQGDVILFGSKETGRAMQHVTIFSYYSSDKQYAYVYGEPGSTSTAKLQKFPLVSDDWYFNRAFRYTGGWTVDSAYIEAKKLIEAGYGNIKYSENENIKLFIDALYADGVLSDKQYKDITGKAWLGLGREKSLEYVRDLLLEEIQRLEELGSPGQEAD